MSPREKSNYKLFKRVFLHPHHLDTLGRELIAGARRTIQSYSTS
jgi:hypothetical protein